MTHVCACKQDYAAAFQRASELGMTLARPQAATGTQETLPVVAQVICAFSAAHDMY